MKSKLNYPLELIAALKNKAEEMGVDINLNNLDERINAHKTPEDAFPEFYKFEYKSDRDFQDTVHIMFSLWNNYPREEFNGETPEQRFNSMPKKEVHVKRLLNAELMKSINPNGFSSEKEFQKAADGFQKKWLNMPRKEFGGKTPMEIVLEERQKTGNPDKGLHITVIRKKMAVKDGTIKSFFSENPEKENLKSIENREYEYAEILSPLEFAIAHYYVDNPGIKDSDAVSFIKNFLKDYDRKFEEGSMEERLQYGAMLGLEKYSKNRKISEHEFALTVKHILWSISNRDWVPDERAYLNWICNFFGLLNEKEKEEFDRFYDKVARTFGISNLDDIIITGERNAEIEREEEPVLKIGETSGFRFPRTPGRNEPCPCGSGKKYKRCCINKAEKGFG